MLMSVAYTLAASAVGIVAGLWLCLGSAFMSSASIAELATSYWDYSEQHADAVISQSAQYSIGAPLLIIAFVLQVLAAVADPASRFSLPQFLASPTVFLLCALLPILAISFIAYRVLLRIKGAQVHKILSGRTS